ncbi:MAG: sigma-70 family RNA polymerase sigma factor [Rhizomicrobium sp.]
MRSHATTEFAATTLLRSPLSVQFERDLIALIPAVQRLSRRLCNRRAIAEDMAQQALMKAWGAQSQFEPGTSLKAWVFTILRNEIYSHNRRAWRETNLDSHSEEHVAGPADRQEWAVQLSDTVRALEGLPQNQRDAIMLVRVGGYSYDEASIISQQSIGTVKSQVSRGRVALMGILEGNKPLSICIRSRGLDASEDLYARLQATKKHRKTGAVQPD